MQVSSLMRDVDTLNATFDVAHINRQTGIRTYDKWSHSAICNNIMVSSSLRSLTILLWNSTLFSSCNWPDRECTASEMVSNIQPLETKWNWFGLHCSHAIGKFKLIIDPIMWSTIYVCMMVITCVHTSIHDYNTKSNVETLVDMASSMGPHYSRSSKYIRQMMFRITEQCCRGECQERIYLIIYLYIYMPEQYNTEKINRTKILPITNRTLSVWSKEETHITLTPRVIHAYQRIARKIEKKN